MPYIISVSSPTEKRIWITYWIRGFRLVDLLSLPCMICTVDMMNNSAIRDKGKTHAFQSPWIRFKVIWPSAAIITNMVISNDAMVRIAKRGFFMKNVRAECILRGVKDG